MTMITAGAAVVLPAATFDPAATMAAIERHRGTVIYGVPTMFIAQLEHPEFAQLRLLQPAHRHHGGRALSDRNHAARHR